MTIRLASVALPLIVFLSFCSVADAQQPLTERRQDKLKQSEQEALTDPTLTAFAQGTQDQVTLESAEDTSSVNAKLGGRFAADWLYSVSLKAPFDRSRQEEATLADLDGLGAGTTATLSLTKRFYSFGQEGELTDVCNRYNDERWQRFEETRPCWRPIEPGQCEVEAFEDGGRGEEWARRAVAAETTEALRKACAEYNKAHPADQLLPEYYQGSGTKPPHGFGGFCTEAEMIERMAGATEAEREKAWDKEKEKLLDGLLAKLCEEYNATPPLDELIDVATGACEYSRLKALGPEWAAAAQAASPVNLWFLTFEAQATDVSFKFAQAETLDRLTEEHENTSFGVGLSALLRGFYYGLSYKQQRLYKGADKVELCEPLDGTDALTCSETALGAPAQVDRELGQFDVKAWLTPRVAANLRVIYDFEGEIWNPHLLLYFLRNKEKGVNGGFDISYRDDEDDVKARLFIGTAFDLLPK